MFDDLIYEPNIDLFTKTLESTLEMKFIPLTACFAVKVLQ